MNEHRRIEQLLPWYANGTLGAREMTSVAEHLENCLPCQSSLNAELRLSRTFQDEPPAMSTLLAANERNLNDLLQRISDSDNLRPRFDPKRWLPIALVGGLALFALGAGLQWLLPPGPNVLVDRERVYTPLTTARSGSADVLQVIFQPNTVESDIRGLLLDLDAQLLGSPSPNGVYRLHLPAGHRGDETAARIGAHPAVQWSALELKP